MPFLAINGRDRNSVEHSDHRCLVQAVLERVLAIEDDIQILLKATEQYSFPRYLIEKFVTTCHRTEQRVQFQVLREGLFLRWQLLLHIKIAISIHEKSLHTCRRSLISS